MSGVRPCTGDLWLEDYGGNDLWKKYVLSLEWKREWVVDGESGDADEHGGVDQGSETEIEATVAYASSNGNAFSWRRC